MKIFIDCGTHLFQGFEQFIQKHNIDSEWKCFCFEANPFTYEKSKQKYQELVSKGYNITHYNKAVYDIDGTINVNCSIDEGGPYADGHFSQGSNVLINPPEYDYVYKGSFNYQKDEVKVDSINFSKFIKETVNKNDFVVVKMDIEGAEFPVIPKLIHDETIHLIDKFYCEFHERFFEPKNKYKKMKMEYIKFLKNSGVDIEEWH